MLSSFAAAATAAHACYCNFDCNSFFLIVLFDARIYSFDHRSRTLVRLYLCLDHSHFIYIN